MWEFTQIRTPRAAKPHRCEECGRTIEVGEKHQRISGKCEGEIMDYRLCDYCARLTAAVFRAFPDDCDEGYPSPVRDFLLGEGVTDLEAWLASVDEVSAAEEKRIRLKRGMARASADVLAERIRQVDVKGYDTANDDLHADGQMALAAASYALYASDSALTAARLWPFDRSPAAGLSSRSYLERAGAFILAEIERLDRIEAAK
jgi:hypothetical protein